MEDPPARESRLSGRGFEPRSDRDRAAHRGFRHSAERLRSGAEIADGGKARAVQHGIRQGHHATCRPAGWANRGGEKEHVARRLARPVQPHQKLVFGGRIQVRSGLQFRESPVHESRNRSTCTSVFGNSAVSAIREIAGYATVEVSSRIRSNSPRGSEARVIWRPTTI